MNDDTPPKLRVALRLIHSLQKERGASASHYSYQISHPSPINGTGTGTGTAGLGHVSGIGASLVLTDATAQHGPSNTNDGNGCFDGDFFYGVVRQARQHTNLAFQMLHQMLDHESGWAASLERVRNKIDDSCNSFSPGGVGASANASARVGNYTMPSLAEACDTDTNTSNANNNTFAHQVTSPMRKQTGIAIGSHRVVVMFNILIGNIIDECIVKLIQHELKSLNKHYGTRPIVKGGVGKHSRFLSQEFVINNSPSLEDTKRFMGSTMNMARSLPMNTNDDLNAEYLQHIALEDALYYPIPSPAGSESALTPYGRTTSNPFKSVKSADKLAKQDTSNDMDAERGGGEEKIRQPSVVARSMQRNENIGVGSEYSVSIRSLLMPPPTVLISPVSSTELRLRSQHQSQSLPQSHHSSSPGRVSSASVAETMNVRHVRNLLSLLLLFVRLKESMGTERAILSSLMALSPEIDGMQKDVKLTNAHSTKKLFSDLVVEEANQRRIARELQEKVKTQSIDYSLLGMVEKFTTPSAEMRDVQDMIKDFNLKGLRSVMPLKDFWTMITLYIDQLHALELMLIEELRMSSAELCLEEKTNIGSGSGGRLKMEKSMLAHIMKNPDWKILSESEVAQELAKMPAEQIKHLLLRHVQGNDAAPTPALGSSESTSETSLEVEAPRGQFPNPLLQSSVSPPHNLQEWEIDLYEIEFRQRIGRGLGGTTYLAKWSGQQVAVKVSANTDLGLEGWYTEVHSLKRLHHPNVIRLLGAVYNPSPQTYGLVLEYCNSGDLSKALQRPTPPNFFWKIADDVANGMGYLHRKQILHRDIKPGNILLEGDVSGGSFSAKLTDFGVAIMHESAAGEEHTAETGTYRWMSPEVIRHESYSFMADVYSYAVVVWQLVTREIPFEPMSQLEAAGKVAIENARPVIPQGIPELIMALIKRCWSQNPDDRLPFAQISIELKEIHKSLSNNDKDWLRCPLGHPVYNMEKIQKLKMKLKQESGGQRSFSMATGSQRSQRGTDDGERRAIMRSKSPGKIEKNQKKQNGIFSFFNNKKGGSAGSAGSE